MLRFRVNGKCWAITGGRQEPEIDLEYSQRFVGIRTTLAFPSSSCSPGTCRRPEKQNSVCHSLGSDWKQIGTVFERSKEVSIQLPFCGLLI